MPGRRVLYFCGVALSVFGFLQLAAGVLFWDWGSLRGADPWTYTARPWWPLALLVFLLTCVIMALIYRQGKLDSRLADLERGQSASPPKSLLPVDPPSSKGPSTAFTEKPK